MTDRMRGLTICIGIVTLLFLMAAPAVASGDSLTIIHFHSSPTTDPLLPPEYLMDGDPATAWGLLPGARGGWAELHLGEESLIYGLKLEGFLAPDTVLRIEYRAGDAWRPFLLGHLRELPPDGIIDLSYDRAVTDAVRLRLEGDGASSSRLAELLVLGAPRNGVLFRLTPRLVEASANTLPGFPARFLLDGNTRTTWRVQSGGEDRAEAVFDLGETYSLRTAAIYLSPEARGLILLEAEEGETYRELVRLAADGVAGWKRIELNGISARRLRLVVAGREEVIGGIGELVLFGNGPYPGDRRVPLLPKEEALTAPFNLEFAVEDPRAGYFLELVCTGLSSEPLVIELNGREFQLAAMLTLNGRTLYVLELPEEDLLSGSNFLRIKPGFGRVLGAAFLARRSGEGIVLPAGGLADRLLLTPVSNAPEIVFPLGQEAFLEEVMVFAEGGEGIEAYIGEEENWIPLSRYGEGLPLRFVGPVSGRAVKIVNPHGCNINEIVLLGSPTTDGPPAVKILHPPHGAFLPMGAIGREEVLGFVDDCRAEVKVNGLPVEGEGHFFRVKLAHLHPAPWESLVIEAVARDEQGREGRDRIEVYLGEAELVELDGPAGLLRTTAASYTVSGRVLRNGVKVEVNGTTIPVTNRRFRMEVPLEEGFNRIEIAASFAPPGGKKEFRQVMTRSIVREKDEIELVVESPADGSYLKAESVVVTGWVHGPSPLLVTVNGLPVKPAPDGFFTSAPVSLTEGENRITVEARAKDGRMKKAELVVFADRTAPVITLTAPVEGAILNTSSVAVTGWLEEAYPASLIVNGRAVEVIGGAFSTTVTLPEGANSLVIQARDLAGNTAILTRTVTVDLTPPLPFTLQGPTGYTNNNRPEIGFAATDTVSGIAAYYLRVDGGDWQGPVVSPYRFEEALPDGEHVVEVKAVDRAGWETVSSPLSFIVDTIPPDPPAVVRAIPGKDWIKVVWKLVVAPPPAEGEEMPPDPPDPPMKGYLLERRDAEGRIVRWELGDVKEYLDSDLPAGAAYAYRIAAVDLAGNVGAFGDWVEATVGVAVVEYTPDAGAVVEYGGLVMAIPVNTLPEGKEIVITEIECPSLFVSNLDPNDVTATPSSLPTGAQYPLGPVYFVAVRDRDTGEVERGTELEQTVLAKIAYPEPSGDLADFPEENLSVYWFDPVFNHWFEVPSIVDKEKNEIYFFTNHFSLFSVQPTIVQDVSPEEYRDMGISPLKTYATHGPVNVSPMMGTMSTRAVDLVLPGRDGEDLVIARTYDSATARADALGLEVSARKEIRLGTYSNLFSDFESVWNWATADAEWKIGDPITNLVKKIAWAYLWCQGDAAFSPGQGWRLEFPYIKLVGSGAYLRMPSGAMYNLHHARLAFQGIVPSQDIGFRVLTLVNEEDEYFTLKITQIGINHLPLLKDVPDWVKEAVSLIPSWIPVQYELTLKDGARWHFDMFGRPTRKEDACGRVVLRFAYDGIKLDSITDSVGRRIRFAYDNNLLLFPRVERIWLEDDGEFNRKIVYEVDDRALLIAVTDPGGRRTEYDYKSKLLVGGEAAVELNILAIAAAILAPGSGACDVLEFLFGPSVTLSGRVNLEFAFPMREIRTQAGGKTTIAYEEKLASRVEVKTEWFLLIPVSVTISGSIETRLLTSRVTVYLNRTDTVPASAQNYTYQMKPFDIGEFLVDKATVTDGEKRVEYHFITKRKKRYHWEDCPKDADPGQHPDLDITTDIPYLTLVFWRYEDVSLNDYILTYDQATGELLEAKYFAYDDEQGPSGDLGSLIEDGDNEASLLLVAEKTVRGSTPNGINERLVLYAHDDYGNVTYMKDTGGIYKQDGVEYIHDDREVWTKYVNSTPKPGMAPPPPVLVTPPFPAPNLSSTYRGLIEWQVEKVYTPLGSDGRPGYRLLQTFYDYNEYGQVTQKAVWDGERWRITRYAYDPATHYLVETVEPDGQVTHFTYDEWGFPASVVKKDVRDADGNSSDIITRTGYDRMTGWKVWEKDGRGYVTEYRYDALGRVVATVLPDDDDDPAWDPASGPSFLRANNPVQRVVFDDLALKTTVIDPLGNKVTYDYDTRGYLVEIVKSTKAEERYAVTKLVYDAYGRIVEIVDPNGNAPGVAEAYKYTTRYEYDALGNLKKVVYPDETPAWTDNPTKTYLRDLVAMKTTITDEEGKITEQYHDMEGRIHKEVKLSYQGNIETVTVYDGAGNKVELTDPRGYVTRMYYDALNQLVRVEMPRDTFWENGAQVTVTPVITYAYDLAGNRTAETREAGGGRTHTVTTAYDGLRRPISVSTTFTDRDGTVKTAVTKTYYDANGNKVKVVDANNTQKPEAERKYFTYTYSARGWLLSETDPEGHTVSYTYDAVGNRISLTDQRGNATEMPNDYTIRYEYDDLYRLVRAVLPDETPEDLSDNPVVRFTYDRRGTNLSKETRPNEASPGQLTTYSYYPRYRLKAETVSGGGQSLTTSYTYDKVGNLKTVTDPRGQTTTYEYDDFHRKVKVVYPEGNTESYEYDKAGNMTALIDGRGRITRYAYNSQNKLISVTDASGAVTSYGYDRWGNQTRMRRPEGQVTTYAYDELNRLTKVTDPLGFATLYGYDLAGNRIYAKDPNGNESFYTYDADNLLRGLLVLNGRDGKYIEYEYDAAHQQLSAMQYIAHLAEGMSEPELSLESRLSRTYTVLGQVASETRQAAGLPARTVTYAYDYLGNISSMFYPEATQPVAYNYTDLGQLVEVPGFITGITYDRGLPETVRYANGVTLSYTYDRNGRLDMRTDTHGGTQLFSLDLNYDANGNIIGRSVNGQVNTYAYDDLNQLVHADLYARQSEQVRVSDYGLGQVHEDYRGDKVVEVEPEDFEVNLDYAATSLSVVFNQVAERIQRIELMPQEINHRLNNKRYLAIYYKTSGDYQKLHPADWEFALDAATGKITITFPDLLTAYEVKIHCLFDDRDKDYLPVKKRGTTSEFANLARSMVRVYRVYERRYEEYIYDRNGNRISETITTLYPRTYGYTYYPNSDRFKIRETADGEIKWAFVYDNNGNLIEKGNTYTIAGDAVTFTTSGEGVVYWQYEYDVFNRLVSVKKNGVTVSRYVYDPSGLRIVKEAAETRIYDYDLDGNVIGETNVTNGKTFSYVWVSGRHLARVHGVIGGTGEKYFYECDHLGSPMVVTDQGGRVVWRGDYAPFGEKIKGEVEAGVFVDTHGFTGKDWDEDVGLYYFNARWYEPEIGRFLQEDPKRDSFNWYVYVNNNPLIFVDPDGLEIIVAEALQKAWDIYATTRHGKAVINRFNTSWYEIWEDPANLKIREWESYKRTTIIVAHYDVLQTIVLGSSHIFGDLVEVVADIPSVSDLKQQILYLARAGGVALSYDLNP
ncbi:MAG: RHS repeat-associated core domain-containing protein [Bacillota bacterium]